MSYGSKITYSINIGMRGRGKQYAAKNPEKDARSSSHTPHTMVTHPLAAYSCTRKWEDMTEDHRN